MPGQRRSLALAVLPNQCAAGVIERCDSQLAIDLRVSCEELVEALAGREPVEQNPDGHTCSLEHSGPAVNVGIAPICDGWHRLGPPVARALCWFPMRRTAEPFCVYDAVYAQSSGARPRTIRASGWPTSAGRRASC